MRGTTRMAATVAALVTIAVPASASARSVYVGDINTGQIATLTQDASTGVLTPASDTPSGSSPTSVALTPDGKNLYAGDYGAAQIYAYTVAADGSLTAKPGSPYATGGPTNGITATADGKHLYAANSGVSGTISGYAIGAGGALTPLPGSPYTAAPGLIGIASSPDSKLLYATTDSGPNRIVGFSIGAEGALTAVPATLPSPGTKALGAVFSPNGKRLYVAQYAEDRVAAYDVDPSGALTEVAGSPFTVGDQPYGLAMAPDGKRLYVPGSASNDLASYPVSADGSLGAATATVPAGSGASSPTVSPDSRFVYSGAFGVPTAFGFAAGDNGALTPLAGSPYMPTSASDFQGVAISPNRSPRARIKVVPGSPSVGQRVRFNASESADDDGTIATYHWRLGAGKPETTTTPIARRTYKKPGTYTATLTVTDAEGCSAKPIYTGQTASCEGSARAVATRTFEVVDREVDKPKVKADKKQEQKGAEIQVVVRAGAAEPVDVVTTGTLKIKKQGKRMALSKVKKSVRAKKDKKFKLRLKRGMAASFKVSRALQAKRRVDATVKVRMRDEAGNTYAETVKVRLKR